MLGFLIFFLWIDNFSCFFSVSCCPSCLLLPVPSLILSLPVVFPPLFIFLSSLLSPLHICSFLLLPHFCFSLFLFLIICHYLSNTYSVDPTNNQFSVQDRECTLLSEKSIEKLLSLQLKIWMRSYVSHVLKKYILTCWVLKPT